MKKVGIVLSVAAVAAITGCKDPSYQSKRAGVNNEVKEIEIEPSAPAEEVKPAQPIVEDVPAAPVVEEVRHCTCLPGTVHTSPCTCGAPDCTCTVAEPEPEYTVYIVQRGDYLAKISKKYNITIAAIKKANPNLKGDVIKIGQKLNLPGKVDVGEQKEPLPTPAATSKAPVTPYTGATVEYVVKSGDTLGAIAYGHGIKVRQLKELNGLSSDMLKVGQKLKVPAAKVVEEAKSVPEKKPAPVKDEVKPLPAAVDEEKVESVKAPVEPVETKVEETAEKVESQVQEAVESVADEAAAQTYVVQEGDDLTGVSIDWGVSASAIRELNNMGEDDQLVPGQIIKLPPEAEVQQ